MPEVLVPEATSSASERADRGDQAPSTGALLLNSVPKLGVWAWTFVGLVLVLIIVVTALSTVSEIVLPLTFAAVLAIIFKPLVGVLKRHKVKPTLAAGVVVLGLLALTVLVVVATIRGVTDQVAQIGASVNAALDSAAETLEVDQASLEAARPAVEELAPAITTGFLTHLVEGVGTLVGVASGLILGALITYYLLKDGTRLRRAVVAQVRPRLRGEFDSFLGEAFQILRDYGRGRTSCLPLWRW